MSFFSPRKFAVLCCALSACSASRIGAAQNSAPAKVAAKAPVLTAQQMQQQRRQQQRAQVVTSQLRSFLSRRISSPTGKMTLQIKPAPRADLGYFNEVFIAGAPLKIKKLRVSDFSLRARNVHIDPSALLRLKDRDIRTFSAQTSARAVISEDDLTWMFSQGNTSKSMGLRAKFIGNQIRVTGDWNWGWLSGPVSVLGTLQLVKSGGGNQVFCNISSLKLNGSEVPGFLRNKFSDQLNPLISYDQLPFKPNIRSLSFQGTKAILST